MDACEAKPKVARTDWTEIERLKKEASRMATELEVGLKLRRLHWDELKALCSTNSTLWKLLLKELRLRGYDIGNYKQPYVTKRS